MTFRGRVFRIVQYVLSMLRASLAVGVRASEVRSAIMLLHPKASPFPLVRIGGTSPGYLIPDDLDGIVACFSPGVGESAEFELALAEIGIPSFLADYSVDKSPVDHDLLKFEKLFIATHTECGKFIRFEDWMDRKEVATGDLLLQMDIEGNEWPILSAVSAETLSRFRVIVLELHGLDNLLTNPIGVEIFNSIFRKLNDQFSVVHLHANNCCGSLKYRGLQIPRALEVTFIRKDRYKFSSKLYQSEIPNSLDVSCIPSRKELLLTEDWLGS